MAMGQILFFFVDLFRCHYNAVALSADKLQTAGLVIQLFQLVAEDIFIWSV